MTVLIASKVVAVLAVGIVLSVCALALYEEIHLRQLRQSKKCG